MRDDSDLLTRFAEHLRDERGLAERTREAYGRDLRRYHTFLTTHRASGLRAATPHDVRACVTETHRDGLEPRSLQRLLSSIRALYRYLLREGVVARDPAADVRAPKAPRRLPQTLDADQTARLLESAAGADPLARRDRAMFELMYSSGLRLSELASLDAMAADSAELRVQGKGARTRIVPVGRIARAAVAAWLEVRASMAAPDCPALFVSRRGGRLSTRAIQQRLGQLARRSGLGRPVHPHMLRHACATHLLESSGDLRSVQELLGHANIATTQIYTHLDFQHLAEVYDRAHPRARRRRP